MHPDQVELSFTEDPASFLAQAGPLLAADPVATTVVSTATRRLVGAPPAPSGGVPRWWVVARHDGEVVGAGMRTLDVAPYAAYVLAMPDAAAQALARALHERGEDLPAVNGARPAVDVLAAELARLTGTTTRVDQQHHLHVLGTPRAPRPTAGVLRRAVPAQAALAREWFDAFVRDADRQAGRAPGVQEPHRLADVASRVDAGLLWCWSVDGVAVHLTGTSAPADGVVRVGPVYTPPEHRGRGYASAAVHAVSGDLRAAGLRVCLFTDRDNPTPNHVYADLGFEVVGETALHLLDAPAGARPPGS